MNSLKRISLSLAAILSVWANSATVLADSAVASFIEAHCVPYLQLGPMHEGH